MRQVKKSGERAARDRLPLQVWRIKRDGDVGAEEC